MAHLLLRSRIAAVLPLYLAAAISGCGDSNVGKAESVAALAGAAGGPGYFDGTGTLVRFSSPSGVAVIGTDLFVADTANHVIRKIDTNTGSVTTFAGTFGVADNTDGTGAAARFNSPTGITAVGTLLFVCDTGNHTIRKIVSTSGLVTTLAGSAGNAGSADNVTGANARFNGPRGIAGDGATLYVADTGNHKIRAVTFSGSTSTFAGSGASGSGNGLGTAAEFSSPEGVTVLAGGTTTIYVADTGNHTIRQIDPVGAVGNVTTLAGLAGTSGSTDNTGANARFSSPSGIANDGATIFVGDTGNHTIRSVTQSGVVTTPAGLAGTPGSADGTGSVARFNSPKGIGMLAGSGFLFVADRDNHAIRRITAVALAGAVTTVAGNPPQAGTADATGTTARFRAPAGAAVVSDNVFVADTGNHTIRKVTSTGAVTTPAGSPGSSGLVDGTGSAARFSSPQGIAAVDSDLYVADSGNNAIRKVTAAGVVTTFAGSTSGTAGFVNDTGTAARFNTPRGITTDGSFLFVADTGNHAVRKINISTREVTTLAGTGSAGFADTAPAAFNGPEGVAVIGSNLYVADTGNHAIRKLANFNSLSPIVTTFAGAPPPTAASGFTDGSGTSARFSSPKGIAAVGSVLYLADTGNHAARRITTAATVTTFAGDPASATNRDGDASQALLNAPAGITGITGTIFFTDLNENVVRKILF
ncbi:MAG: hypothetical protein HZA60_10330 [Deltaproteobacteria bacterium]|nr:hypothetical protein [Deltaproteobacteria bacterium]